MWISSSVLPGYIAFAASIIQTHWDVRCWFEFPKFSCIIMLLHERQNPSWWSYTVTNDIHVPIYLQFLSFSAHEMLVECYCGMLLAFFKQYIIIYIRYFWYAQIVTHPSQMFSVLDYGCKMIWATWLLNTNYTDNYYFFIHLQKG